MIRVATAGWSYPDWAGRVHPQPMPRGVHPLTLLAQFLDGVEVNATFYARTRADVVARWVEAVRRTPDFRFTVKASQRFTHGPEDLPAWEEEAEALHAALVPMLRRRLLAGVLVQFPATFHAGPEEVRRLGRIRSLLDPLPLVLEVRHRSWFEPPQLKSLGGLGYSVAHIDLPSAWDHPPARFRPTGPIGYLRLHGRNHSTWFRAGVGRDARYDYLYAPPEVGELAERADAISREVDETWVVTNNHFEGQAVANALELKWLLGGRDPVAAPATLVEAFPHLESLTRSVGQQGMFGGDEG